MTFERSASFFSTAWLGWDKVTDVYNLLRIKIEPIIGRATGYSLLTNQGCILASVPMGPMPMATEPKFQGT